MLDVDTPAARLQDAEEALVSCERAILALLSTATLVLPWHLEAALRRGLAACTAYQDRWADLVRIAQTENDSASLVALVLGQVGVITATESATAPGSRPAAVAPINPHIDRAQGPATKQSSLPA